MAGATKTSTGIITAVTDCLAQAGADLEALKLLTPPPAEKEEDQEYTADVVVIGADGAGMAAAVQANQLGKNVIVVEKSMQMGGNTILSGGAFNAVEDGSEMAAKYDDSVEKHYTQTFNGGDPEGEPDEFGRTLFTDGEKKNNGINTAPFYAAGRVPTVHHTMGGVEINEKTEVLDTEGSVIPGFYAAGEVTGGIHGTNRLGGNALTDTIVFGRIAGEMAAGFQAAE